LQRGRRKFYKRFERVFEDSLLRSSDYDALLRDLRRRLEESMDTLAKREAEIYAREAELHDLEKKLKQAEKASKEGKPAASQKAIKEA